jgi:hypothetical protein
MSVPPGFENLIGPWKGVKKLWLTPKDPMRESDTKLQVVKVVEGKFLLMHYNWDFEGAYQDGMLLVGYEEKPNKVEIVWADSWHMRDAIMTCIGQVEKDGSIYARGSYPAPTGPDWGWSIRLKLIDEDQWQLQMENITPAGAAMLAVEIDYFCG